MKTIEKDNHKINKLQDHELSAKSHSVRKDLIEVALRNEAGHIASSLSSADILVSLYYSIMNISKDPTWADRDRLIFSKAHGCYALYSILSDIGYIKRNDWENFYKGRILAGCIEQDLERGIEVGCGSLGHGLPMAVGTAFGAKLQKKDCRTYCVVGDGEMQEGSNWEAIQFAVKHELSNLTIIIDNNRLQAMDFLENILTPKGRNDDLERKMQAFGCEVKTCDGHNPNEIVNIIKEWINAKLLAPQALVANTTKGHGLVCMENIPKFHFRIPTQDELKLGNRYE